MNVAGVETLHCDAGWRNYHFVKLTTTDGVIGWSEYDENFGSLGVTSIIEHLAKQVSGRKVGAHEKVYTELYAHTRPASGGVVGIALGAIENALLDAKAKSLGVPCYDLLGGKLRDRIRLYWSHCATWRIVQPKYYPPEIKNLGDVKAIGAEVRQKGFSALKTNAFVYENGSPKSWMPGFGRPFEPGRNVERNILQGIRSHLGAFREGAGPDMDFMVDLNFNCSTEGYIKILQEIADLDIFWAEIDTFSPSALSYIRRKSQIPISSGEALIGIRDFLPYFKKEALDVAIIDAVWNGIWQSMKIAACAEAHEVNIAPHNFYSHLSTLMNAHFAAAVPNLKIMEVDMDRLSWDHELFTFLPEVIDGHLIIPDRPGWGTEPKIEALLSRPPKKEFG